jgi:hypothetical protein
MVAYWVALKAAQLVAWWAAQRAAPTVGN